MRRLFFKDDMGHDSAILLSLQCHPSTPAPAVRGVSIGLSVGADDTIRLAFDIDSIGDTVLIPAPKPRAFQDGLWRHTCFELFARRADGAYREFNFSPSTDYAVYDFAEYRTGMTPVTASIAPSIQPRRGGLSADILLSSSLLKPAGHPAARLGVATVIEERNGTLSYWALRHPRETPDFHARDGFTIDWPLRGGAGEDRP